MQADNGGYKFRILLPEWDWHLECLRLISLLCFSPALNCFPLFLILSVPLKSLCSSLPPVVEDVLLFSAFSFPQWLQWGFRVCFNLLACSLVSTLPRELPFPISKAVSSHSQELRWSLSRNYHNTLSKLESYYERIRHHFVFIINEFEIIFFMFLKVCSSRLH